MQLSTNNASYLYNPSKQTGKCHFQEIVLDKQSPVNVLLFAR